MTNEKAVAKKPVSRLKEVMASPSVQEQFRNALADNAPLFVASVIDLFSSDTYLQKCDPALVVAECLKAATLKLPINKSLGFAYVVPYKGIPQFQVGYKGLLQLALRTGQYRRLNDGAILEGQAVKSNPLTGDLDISGDAKSDKAIGFFAYFQLTNGFEKSIYLTAEQAIAHGKKFSASFSSASSPWKTNFEAMAIKTCWKKILSKYGIMSVEMINVMANDDQPAHEADYQENANKTLIDITPEPDPPANVNTDTGEITGQGMTAEELRAESMAADAALAAQEQQGEEEPY